MQNLYTSFSKEDIADKLDSIFRINLINSCTGYKPANLIATISKTGQENVAVFSSIVHLGSNPPLVGFIVRPTTVSRNTLENIRETGNYTINAITKSIISDAHHTSAKYPKDISEFSMTNLEAEFKTNITCPFVKNAPVQLHLSLVEEIPIPINQTILVIGEIQHLFIQENILTKNGSIALERADVATIRGLNGYTTPTTITEKEYQHPKPLNNTQHENGSKS